MRRRSVPIAIVALGLAAWPGAGSDHYDGLKLLADKAVDLADLLAFPSPQDPGRLVLAMTLFPGADRESRFSDQAVYAFRLRSLEEIGEGLEAVFDDRPENRVECVFDGEPQQASCATGTGFSARVAVDETGGGPSPALRVFAGLRADPYFMDVTGFAETLLLQKAARLMPADARRYLDGPKPGTDEPRVFRFSGTNTVADHAVLAIVVEVDVAEVFGPGAGPLFAVAAEVSERPAGGGAQ